jgi:hypothetical protein
MKFELYTWRVSTEVKTRLQSAARVRRVLLSSLLDTAARECLARVAAEGDNHARQHTLHSSASKSLGVLASGNARGSETVREAVRSRLRQRYGR